MQIDFVEPWVAVSSERISFEEELRCELSPDNPLSFLVLRAIGRRIDCDDVLFEACNEKADFKLVVVHLTWSGRTESNLWPTVKLFADAADFTAHQMMHDAQCYNM